MAERQQSGRIRRAIANPAVQASLVAILITVFGLTQIDDDFGTALILSLTAAGVGAYAVLVHDQAMTERRALQEQRKANKSHTQKLQEQLEHAKLQLDYQNRSMQEETIRWKLAQQVNYEGKLDSQMPFIEITPMEMGIFNDAGSRLSVSGDEVPTFGIADDDFLTWRVSISFRLYGDVPVNIFLPSRPHGDYTSAEETFPIIDTVPNSNQLLRPGAQV